MTASQTMRVTILGSGTCVPSLKRSACAALLAVGRSRVLLDCGPGTMRRLLEAGTTIHEVTHLLLSHFHPDHSAELVPFLFATKYPDRRQRRRPLTIVGGGGFHGFFEGLREVYGGWIDIGDRLGQVIEMDTGAGDECRFEDFRLSSMPMAHNPESLAYRITGPSGRSLVYSGDTDDNPNLVTLARGADVLICESALPDERRAPGHLTPSLAGEVASRAGVGRLVLTHFYPECDQVDVAAQCRRTWAGELVLAEDLMQLEV